MNIVSGKQAELAIELRASVFAVSKDDMVRITDTAIAALGER